jgi:hypothetical protein
MLKVTIESVVDPNWIGFMFSSEIFSGHTCRYWARGVAWDESLGWLVWESADKARRGAEPDRERALTAWRAGEPLPPRWHRLDDGAIVRAWEAGVRRWGESWHRAGDGTRHDEAVQVALLGEARYG